MKTCPNCAEEIQDEAIVCKHCGRELVSERWRDYCARYASLTPEQQRLELARLTVEQRAEAERAWKALGLTNPHRVSARPAPRIRPESRGKRKWRNLLLTKQIADFPRRRLRRGEG